jgi:hypothetical protein
MALGVIVGTLLPVISALIASFHSAKVARQHVTPLISPMDNEGHVLAPVLPVARHRTSSGGISGAMDTGLDVD